MYLYILMCVTVSDHKSVCLGLTLDFPKLAKQVADIAMLSKGYLQQNKYKSTNASKAKC